MELDGARVIITGGGSGIGRAMARRFAADGAAVTVGDLAIAGAEETASSITASGGRALAVGCDVRDEAAVQSLVAASEEAFGPTDLFCSNAGVAIGGGPDAPDGDWDTSWQVHVMSHVYAARAVLPGMLEQGRGYLLQTASAAGLLTNLGAAPYSVTKHAAVGFAEWLAITYGDRGITVSCLCPQGVNTPLLNAGRSQTAGSVVVASGQVLEPSEVADAVVEGLRDERFLILPHPEVLDFVQRKAGDYDRWLAGMRRLQARIAGALGSA